MRAKFATVWVIVRREVRDQFRDWRIVLPIVALTVFFPWLLNYTANSLSKFMAKYGAQQVGDRLIPFLLLMVGFFPITVSLVIALESFVGEKERRSIEPLLSSPLEGWQLYLGKLLASLVMPLLASYLGTVVYLVGIARVVGWRPPTSLIVQVLALATVQGLVMVSGAVVVSSQTTSTRAANLLASFIIVPMALLIEGESLIMFWARYDVLWWSILGQLVIAGLLVRMGISYFNREELLGRELDSLNLRWSWRVFKEAFIGAARNPREWFFHEVRHTLQRQSTSLIFVIGLLSVSLVIGASQASSYDLPKEMFDQANFRQSLQEGLQSMPLFSVGGIPTIWLHNLRAISLATLMGVFTFGVLGILVIMMPLFLVGYFASAAAAAGFSPWLFLLAFIAPHGVLEIPALALIGGSILRLGATLAAPAKGKTIGEAWLIALADWARVFLALVVPLLLAAAALETLVTPRLAQLILGGG